MLRQFISSQMFFPGVGLSGTSHRDDVRLQEAGEDSHQEEERRSHGSEWETDTGRAAQPICGEKLTNGWKDKFLCNHKQMLILPWSHWSFMAIRQRTKFYFEEANGEKETESSPLHNTHWLLLV